MPDDAVHALCDKGMGGANAEFKGKLLAERAEAVCTEESACEGENDAGEKGGGECGEIQGEYGGRDGVEERAGEGGWTISTQCKEDRAPEEPPGPC